MAAHARISKYQDRCRRCDRPVSVCGRLTWVGQCMNCAEGRMVQNLQELRDHEGQAFERWRSALVRSLQAL